MTEQPNINEHIDDLRESLFEPFPPTVDIIDSLHRYVHDRIETGSFLRAVLENDLKESMGRADDVNRHQIFNIVSWCYNQLPAACWGSPEKVKAWLAGPDAKGEA